MVPDKITHVGPTGQPHPAKDGAEKTSNDPQFRRMLERLEEIARQNEVVKKEASKKTDKAAGTDEFMHALKKADDDFVAAMDLRRKLEEAYRRSQP